MMKKIITLLFVASSIILTISCDSDDDLPSSEEIVVNNFCYGDGTTGFDIVGSYRTDTELTTDGDILTQVTVYGDGLSLNDMDQLEGMGALIDLDFYGNSTAGFQTGLYQISNLTGEANVNASYALDYDVNNAMNAFISLESGYIRVQTYHTGYAITVDAVDSNGDEFHGILLGNVNIIP